jgi:hypothetical protein
VERLFRAVVLDSQQWTIKKAHNRSHMAPCGDWDTATFGRDAVVTIYHVTLRDRETQTVVGYYNGEWTTDQRRALSLRKREAAEAHAARMRDRCPRNAELIIVEEIAAAD